jgi:magnesium-protoporphyrin IX monomethyl ester (oxidative) cyclase
MEDYYLTPRLTYSSIKLGRGSHMFTSRGCPFNCTFCSSALFWKRKGRIHSAKYVVGEMKEMQDKYKCEGLYICDDLFAQSTSRLKEIVELMEQENIHLIFKIATRVDHINEERVKLFKRMNIQTVCLGFESGSQKTLDYLKKGTIRVEKSTEAIELLKKYKINIHGYFMIGAPYETKEDMLLTLKFIKENPITSMNLCVVTPYPGTELWEFAKERKLVNDDMDWSKLNLHFGDSGFIMINDQMTQEELVEMYRLIEKETTQMMHSVDFSFKQLFSFSVIKRAILQPKRAVTYLYYGIKKKVRL